MYIDLNVSFAAGSNQFVYVEDTKAIVQSLERLFNTKIGTVPFNRNYGSSLWSLLFENGLDNYQVATLIYQEVQTYEPRVKLSPADVVIEQVNEHAYELNVTFSVPSLNNLTGKITSTITE